jgi:hypothetical protein
MKASHARSRVRIELGFLRPANLDSEVRPMVSWLCAQSCADPRVIMHTPGIRSPFGED